MSNRATFEVFTVTPTLDIYGQTEALTPFKTVHGTLTSMVMTMQTSEAGQWFDSITWFRTHTPVDKPSEKVWKLNGTEYKVVTAHQNKRRWHYQVEQVLGGDWYANQN